MYFPYLSLFLHGIALIILCFPTFSSGIIIPSSGASPKNSLPGVKHWSFNKHAPSWCSKMMRKPMRENACHRDRTTMMCSNNREYMMFSQMAQDYYLYTRHFKYLKRRGVYMDVATNDPIGISNTYFMEKCLGWKGMCVEAHPQYLGVINNARNCALVPTCVTNKSGQKVVFALDSGLSGIMSTNKNKRAWEKSGKNVPTIRIECSTMALEAERYKIKLVDYLSLDVEGHELEVLKGFDWDRIKINVMTIEAGNGRVNDIQEFLEEKGYVRHTPDLDERSQRTSALWEDAVFLHRDVVFGKPE